MHREVLFHSTEGREMELITLSSYHNITKNREELIDGDGLLPFHDPKDTENRRPLAFKNKPCVFLTSRVHPGETPASYVLNGILNFLTGRKITKNEQTQAKILMDSFVFKIIPMLNPDGVYRGYYRLDCKS